MLDQVPEARRTPLATSRVTGLRGPSRRAYNAFLDTLAHEGCAAMGYLLTGPVIERLCAKRTKPPCCDDAESTPLDAFGEDEVMELVARCAFMSSAMLRPLSRKACA